MRIIKLIIKSVLLLCFVAGCSHVMDHVPVETIQPIARSLDTKHHYRVQKGDTLLAIARAFSQDYQFIAKANHLHSPYKLYPGQKLLVKQPIRMVTAHPLNKTVKTQHTAHLKTIHTPHNKPRPLSKAQWVKPTMGKVVKKFVKNARKNHGIEISGQYGQNVLAVNSGKVVYSGVGLRGYGKLIIIKHANHILSAYAFNQVLLVKEGERIKAGQLIAKMGKNNHGAPSLHLEIRKNGKPVDPLTYVKWS